MMIDAETIEAEAHAVCEKIRLHWLCDSKHPPSVTREFLDSIVASLEIDLDALPKG